MRHIDYGFSLLDRDAVVPAVTPDRVVDLAGVYHRLSLEHRLQAFEVSERFYEVGSQAGPPNSTRCCPRRGVDDRARQQDLGSAGAADPAGRCRRAGAVDRDPGAERGS
jgi:hypothetical protein